MAVWLEGLYINPRAVGLAVAALEPRYVDFVSNRNLNRLGCPAAF